MNSDLNFRVQREGEFVLKLAQGNECGLDGEHRFRYQFEFDGNELDARGFIVDHHEVAEHIADWAAAGRYRGACEQVAVAIGNIVLSCCKQPALTSHRLTVRLYGSAHANIQ